MPPPITPYCLLRHEWRRLCKLNSQRAAFQSLHDANRGSCGETRVSLVMAEQTKADISD